MSGVLCLKWNNHTSTFIKTLDSLRSKELYCDATIACHGKYFPVHRFVLTTCSEYFEEIFERTQCRHPFIIVKDVEEMQLEALLHYMYKGEVNVLQDRLPGLIRAAEALKVKGLAVTEDEVEEKKPVKEKRKANSTSSPLQPKSKRKHVESSINTDSVKQSLNSVNNDITEIKKPSLPNSSKKNESNNSRTGSKRSENVASNASNLELPFQNNEGNYSDNAVESEFEDVKVEPSEIFESVEDEFPIASNHLSHDGSREESLFCSLLSPNNAHPGSEGEAMPGDEGNSQTMPQCSSWSDGLSTTSDKMQDEINPLKLKPMVELQEGSFAGMSIGIDPLAVGSDSFVSNREALYNALYAPHQCPQCMHRTKTKQELLRHVTYCHSDFRFTCVLCHYKCRTNGLLKKHMLKHTKEKPYSCPVCPYKTARKQHLVRHSKLHTGEKPYSCTICNYKASRKDRLREHLRKHPEIEEFNFELNLNKNPEMEDFNVEGNAVKNQEVDESNFDACEN